MISASVSDQVMEWAQELLKAVDLGRRGFADGDHRKQLAGAIAQAVVHDGLRVGRPVLTERPGGGFDLTVGSTRVEVKSTGRTKGPVLPHHAHNIYAVQMSRADDAFAFCSFHSSTNQIVVCGWLTHREVLERAEFFPAGTERHRDNGTSFKLQADTYELRNDQLHNVNSWEELGVALGAVR